MSRSTTDDDEDPATANQVLLRGRLAGEPVLRELPSGDTLAVFRLTVPRSPQRNRASRVRVDSLECASTLTRVRRSLERAAAGGLIEVSGSLHRRFWRSPTGPTSRYAVDVRTVRVSRAGRSTRPGRPTDASTARTQASA